MTTLKEITSDCSNLLRENGVSELLIKSVEIFLMQANNAGYSEAGKDSIEVFENSLPGFKQVREDLEKLTIRKK